MDQNIKLVFQADQKERLDKILTNRMPYNSRVQIQNTIKTHGVLINQKQIFNCSYKVQNGDLVEFINYTPAALLFATASENIDFDIIYEDQDLIVINKPAGLTVHPGAGNQNNTLVNGLIARYGSDLSNIGGDFRPGIVHRLDKDTSGLMLVAKNNRAHQLLSQMITHRKIERKYIALVYGVPFPLNGKIEHNIGRSRINRLKMTVMKKGGRTAITHYKTLKIYGRDTISIVECKLETGRTHQIRVHLNYNKNSIIGDPLYCNAKKNLFSGLSDLAINTIKEFTRQALHSCFINFNHPITNHQLSFYQDPPNDMSTLIDNLSK